MNNGNLIVVLAIVIGLVSSVVPTSFAATQVESSSPSEHQTEMEISRQRIGSTMDSTHFERDGKIAFGGELKINNPGDDPINGDGSANDKFGYAVAISGNTVIVGAAGDAQLAGASVGSAYVFVQSGGSMVRQAKLTAEDGTADDNFGNAIAISGDTVIVGAYRDGRGAAYIFIRNGEVWTEQAKLTNPEDSGYEFGTSVAISGDTAIVGAPTNASGGGISTGAAFVYKRNGNGWEKQAKLSAIDANTEDLFGISVAIEGNTAIVGADNGDDSSTLNNVGAAYVFVRSDSSWTHQAKLTAVDGENQDRFGASLAIAGDTVVVGAPGADNLGGFSSGAAYVYTKSGKNWFRYDKLMATDGAHSDQFGTSVAIDGSTILIGSYRDTNERGFYAGSAYVFVKNQSNWTQQAKLIANDGQRDDEFGNAIAVSGDLVLVGTALSDTLAGIDAGGVYGYINKAGNWIQQNKLTAGVGARRTFFGSSLAVDGDTAVVAVPGSESAYVFSKTMNVWTLQAKLVGGSSFGSSVAISGDTILVGAHLPYGPTGYSAGSVHVFSKSGDRWVQQARLSASDGQSRNYFGYSVAIDQNTAVIGAYGSRSNISVESGAAYVYTRSGNNWTEQARLAPEDAESRDFFGVSVDIADNRIIVGATHDDTLSGADTGSAYVFIQNGNHWTLEDRLNANDAAAGDNFGYAVAIEGHTAVVGAIRDIILPGLHTSSAYVFTDNGESWIQRSKLITGEQPPSDWFGAAVSIQRNTIVVGAIFADNGAGVDGAVYVFSCRNDNWLLTQKLSASDAAGFDQFGHSVAIDADTIFAGVPAADSIASGNVDVGAIYIYRSEFFSDGFEDCR